MQTIRLETRIQAPVEVCFDLARSVDAHCLSVAGTRERAVAGVTTGLLELGAVVTWEAVHFGLRLRLTVKITEFERPRRFVDERVHGPFAALKHVHEFLPAEGGTVMRDVFQYALPCGPLGRLADRLLVHRYLTRLLSSRNRELKRMAEEGGTPWTG